MRLGRGANIAIAVMAAVVTAVVVKGATSLSPSTAPRPSLTGVARTPVPTGSPSVAATSSPGDAGAVRTILFVGETTDLRPRGGAAKSFACEAARTLHWRCQLLTRAPRTDLPTGTVTGPSTAPGTPVGTSAAPGPADFVVVTTAVDDTVGEIRTVLDGLQVAAAARLIILGPITASRSTRVQALVAGERALAAGRGAVFVDPVSEGWITPGTRHAYLDGARLSSLGIPVAAARLAADLGQL